jgi:hypothetical protein
LIPFIIKFGPAIEPYSSTCGNLPILVTRSSVKPSSESEPSYRESRSRFRDHNEVKSE